MSELNHVTAPVLIQALRACVIARRPAFTWGSPGIGKSDAHRQLARLMGAYLIDLRASQFDAVDTRGIPYLHQGRTRWAIPEIFPDAELAASHKMIIVFLDELNAAPLSVQAALYQLVLDRRLGDYELPDNVFILAAGNLESDRAVTNRMSSALADRFFHFVLQVDNDAWERWALGEADESFEDESEKPLPAPIESIPLHVGVLSYNRWRPEKLHDFDPKSGDKSQPTPRGWQYLSDVLKVVEREGLDGQVERALIGAKIGNATGSEFSGFLKICRTLQEPADVIRDPENANISADPSTNWAMCGALAARANEKNIAQIKIYADRLGKHPNAGPEYAMLLMRTASIRSPEIKQTLAFIEWAAANDFTA